MNKDFPDNWDEIKNRKQLLIKKTVRFPDSAFYFLSKVGGASALHVHYKSHSQTIDCGGLAGNEPVAKWEGALLVSFPCYLVSGSATI